MNNTFLHVTLCTGSTLAAGTHPQCSEVPTDAGLGIALLYVLLVNPPASRVN